MISLVIRAYNELGPPDSLVINAEGMTVSNVTVEVQSMAVDAVFSEKDREHRITICSRLSGGRVLGFLRMQPCSDPTVCICLVSVEQAGSPETGKVIMPKPTPFGDVLEVPHFAHPCPFKHVLVRESGEAILAIADVVRSFQ